MAKSNIVTGLDIGSSSVKILVVNPIPEEDDFEILSFIQESSFGVRKGIIIDPTKVTSLIQSVLKKAEEQSGKKINSVYINIGGGHVFSANSRGLVSVSRADQEVSQQDVERVLQAARTFPISPNREILEVIPKEFIIDGEKGIKDPQGMKGTRLEAEVIVLGGFSPYLQNLTSAVLDAGLQINDLVFSPLASARAVLTQKEKELGSAVVDIGAGTTGLAVFEEGNLIHLSVLPIGSGHITSDLAIYLKTDIDVAEKIKTEMGTLSFQGQDRKEKIKTEDSETLVFSLKKVSKVIEARIIEIFREVNKELKKIGKAQHLASGIVLTGGGSKLPKIRDLAKREFRLPCRLGRPSALSALQKDPCLAGVCGLVLTGIDNEYNDIFSRTRKESFLGSLGEKVKKIFKIFIP